VTQTITSSAGSQVYELGTRNATTALRLKDGETQILAGLLQKNESGAVNKVPGLSDLPLLGRLFTNDNHDKSKDELVLLITPHIVRNVTRPDAIYSEFLSGTDNAVGSSSMVNTSASTVQTNIVPTTVTIPAKPAELSAPITQDAKPATAAGAGTPP
jgi:general secretion pathway protein D